MREALGAFLEAQRRRLKPRTVAKYASIVELIEHYLDGYAGDGLDPADQARLREAGRGDGEPPAFCDVFGPEHVVHHVGMFLDYFMVRKVMAGRDRMQAAGTVTRKLGRWLSDHGYNDAANAAAVEVQGGAAARDLPATRELLELLERCVEPRAAEAPQIIEDHFQIVRVERGRVRLVPMVSDEPVTTTLPQPVAIACRPGWTLAAMPGRVRGRWRLAEVTFPRMTDAGGA